jgi:glycosyltransferase involved in cell wall biosynthesis
VKISVLVPSNRPGGLDLLFDSLEQQTFQNFELIVIDNIHQYRSRAITPRASFPFRFIEPRGGSNLDTAYCRTMNTGVLAARGESLLYASDYTYFHPECLELHALLQRDNHAPVTLDYNMCEPPAWADGLPDYGQHAPPDAPEYIAELNATTDHYAIDLASGKLNRFMWSTFARPQTRGDIMGLPVEHRHRPCATREADDYNWASFKNESFPRDLVMSMRGHDEDYDRSHCYQDSEFSYRLRDMGVRWVNGPAEQGMLTIVNPRRRLNFKRMRGPISENQKLCFETKRAELRLPVNPGWPWS